MFHEIPPPLLGGLCSRPLCLLIFFPLTPLVLSVYILYFLSLSLYAFPHFCHLLSIIHSMATVWLLPHLIRDARNGAGGLLETRGDLFCLLLRPPPLGAPFADTSSSSPPIVRAGAWIVYQSNSLQRAAPAPADKKGRKS